MLSFPRRCGALFWSGVRRVASGVGRVLRLERFIIVCHGRWGGTRRSIGTVKNCLYVCTDCHDYIHANPSEAYLKGWLLRDTEENVREVCEE